MKPFSIITFATSRSLIRTVLSVLTCVASAGCASAPAVVVTADSSGIAAVDAAANDAPRVRDGRVEESLIYKLLVAEFARQRGRLDIALENYMEVARESGEAKAAERAVRIAVFARDLEAGVNASALWAEIAPKSTEAAQIHAALLIRSKRHAEATAALLELLHRLEGQSAGKGYSQIGNMLAREKDKAGALGIMRNLVSEAPDDPNALFALGQLLARSGEMAQAVVALKRLFERDPSVDRVVILYAHILQRQGDTEKALEVMTEALQANPESVKVRLTYAHLLVDAKRYEDARTEFERLSVEAPANTDVRYALALLLLQTNHLQESAEQFEKLIYDTERRYAAHYYLGQIAESGKEYENALTHYEEVDRGEHRLNSQIRAAVLMAELGQVDRARTHLQGLRTANVQEAVRVFRAEAELLTRADRLQEAMEIYNGALLEHAENGDLLYARAMLAEKLDLLELLERDLRDILSREPNNADALNALGYTLADRTNRLDEAHELIKRAVELKPNDQYIVDSLGWVLYRLGRHEEAMKQLRHALELRADPEIAAHLGEVLWVMGRKDAAREVWDTALKSTPDDKRLLDVKKRFGL